MNAVAPRADAAFARLPGVDALRGLSIVLVVLHHLGLRVPLPETLPRAVREGLTAMGYESVFLFFVVSGFLIASHSMARWGTLSAMDARAFYARRAARILPGLAALVTALAALHLAGADHYVIDRAGQSLGGAVAAAVFFRVNVYECLTGYLPANWDVLWSLSIEELFYLLFPLLCLTLGRTRALVPALVLLAASLPWTRGAMRGHGLWVQYLDLPGMSAIACGVLAAIAVRRVDRVPLAVARGLVAAGVAAIAVTYTDEGEVWHLLHNGTVLLLAVAAACVCAGCGWQAKSPAGAQPQPQPQPGGADGAARVLSRMLEPLRIAGRLSYEVYLCHMFVVWALVDLWNGPALGVKPSGAGIGLLYLVALAACVALGGAVARFGTEPARRHFTARWIRP